MKKGPGSWVRRKGKMNKFSQTIIIILVILLLAFLFLGLPYFLLKMVNQTAEQAIQPFSQANKQLQTEVAHILHPTPTIIPDPVTIIHEVRSLSRLETIQYTVEKVITAETGQNKFGFLFGDRMLFVAHGVVIAGVDLGKLSSDDLKIKDMVLYVTLPATEVFIATLDNEKSYVYDRDTGIFTKGDMNLETEARKVAEDEIRKAALDDGILEQARINAENYLERLFHNLGYQEIVFLEAAAIP